MTSARSLAIATAILGGLFGGCTARLTEIVLVVDSTVPDLASARVRVIAPEGTVGLDHEVSGAELALPLTLGVARDREPYATLTIEVTGQSTSLGTISRTVRTGWVPGERRVLRIVLDAECAGRVCASDVAATDLPPFDGTIPRGVDASVLDGGSFDGGEIDASALDGGEVDASVLDGGDVDASVVDGGVLDGGSIDGGVVDGGPRDAGHDAVVPGPCGFCPGFCAAGYCFREPWLDAAIGDRHMCVVVREDDFALFQDVVLCRGENRDGQVGPSAPPYADDFVEARRSPRIRHLAAGRAHTCAVDDADDVWCWGNNERYQLGGPDPRARVALPAGRVAALAADGDHTCAVVVPSIGESVIYCWGANDDGQLGDATRSSRSLPLRVAFGSGLSPSDVSAGERSACALTVEGVWCWGSDATGQIGDGLTMSTARRPERVIDSAAFRTPEIGSGHACAVNVEQMFCWGDNRLSQVEPGGTALHVQPRALEGAYRAVATGSNHTIAVTDRGEVVGWGDNAREQLRVGGDATYRDPVPLDVADRIWAGYQSSCWWSSTLGPVCLGDVRLVPGT